MLASVASSERVYWNPDQRPMVAVAPVSEFQQIDSDVSIRSQARAGTTYSALGTRPTRARTQTSVGIVPTSPSHTNSDTCTDTHAKTTTTA